jgi:hypothetical protein
LSLTCIMKDSVGLLLNNPTALKNNHHPDNENGLFCQQ